MRARAKALKIRTVSLFAVAALGSSGCIIESSHADDHHHDSGGDSYQPYWVDVACYATVAEASSSSYPGNTDYAPMQATGAPDTQDWNDPGCVDSPYSWSPEYENAGAEWLDALFDAELRVDRVRLYENYGPGATWLVTLANSYDEGMPLVEYEVPGNLQGPNQPCSVLDLDIDDPYTNNEWTADIYDTVMLDLDTSQVSGWNELDAVEVIGLFDDNSGLLPASCGYL